MNTTPWFKKKPVIFSSIAIILIAIIGLIVYFTTQNNEDKTYDNQFMSSLSKGLERRWNIADSTPDDEYGKAEYKKSVNAELDVIEQYQDKKFEDSKLKEQAVAYINVLKDSKSTLDSYGSDEFTDDWEAQYDKRTGILVKINNIKKITVSKKYQDNLDEILGSGHAANKNDTFKTNLDNMFKSIDFKAQPDEFYEEGDYLDYTATLKNTTGENIENFTADIKLKDDNGTVVDTDYIDADSWNKDESVNFEFSTDKHFSSYEVKITNADIAK
ncbi:hypothetical protein G7084_01265 [Weissella coleopterorum]|uniref:Uncharacterized protein n=1 Tax=Weissella coleopterorum TaxID=2714949 RepID=A0A6G8AYI6_9LACO|nr:FxLYD domain-containing protein [Weissella coleopterorum]QIL50066.1 hypothetical protein G7084_01265 [Weissella coleopterorum]